MNRMKKCTMKSEYCEVNATIYKEVDFECI